MAVLCYMEEKTMPEFTTVSMKEAKVQTTSGRQGCYLHEYIDYILNLPKGQAGRLRIGAEETPATIRRRLGVAAKTLGIPLIIKRSGTDVYFWRENGEEEQPRPRRGRRPRTGSPGGLLPPTMPFNQSEAGEQEGAEEETTPLDQAFTAVE
jgi:hypothetical protein